MVTPVISASSSLLGLFLYPGSSAMGFNTLGLSLKPSLSFLFYHWSPVVAGPSLPGWEARGALQIAVTHQNPGILEQ